MSNNCDFKYTCTPWFIYIIIVILLICSTFVTTLYLSYQSNGTAANKFSATGLISSSSCNCIGFLLCIGLLSLLCPTKPGRIVLWLFVICMISIVLSNISSLITILTSVNIVNNLINKYTSTDNSNDEDIIVL